MGSVTDSAKNPSKFGNRRIESIVSPTSPEDSVLCHLCDSSFKGAFAKYNLKKHLVIHQGDKCFKCSLCSYSTVRKAHVKRHLMTVHGLHPDQASRTTIQEVPVADSSLNVQTLSTLVTPSTSEFNRP